ncbi:hypothetical protein [Catenuloplanes indicus]|uniref:Uncharacterized protein n=1 Tax=Catenuloplanes indicus TaxID=137267 RepID=A0AAE3W7P1_9ACTN|nr:hypothetical protein [Catenuloplanes indicus]MDQ0370184.1 hypothetical protein [Catenuloplanes indicus]
MTDQSTTEAALVGGPYDGETRNAGDTGLIEIENDGLVHRYIHTSKSHDSAVVYNYDGVVNPAGAEDGAEHSADRVATNVDPDANS